MESLLSYVETGVTEGGSLVHGGTRVEREGFFMHPTVLTDVEDHTFVAKEESFGPVMVVSAFENGLVFTIDCSTGCVVTILCCSRRDVDGVIQRANETEYGLAGGVFTKDINKVCCLCVCVCDDHVIACDIYVMYHF